MQSLIDLIDFIDRPLPFILHSFILDGEVALLDCSLPTKFTPKFAELLISMISNCYQSIVIIEDYR